MSHRIIRGAAGLFFRLLIVLSIFVFCSSLCPLSAQTFRCRDRNNEKAYSLSAILTLVKHFASDQALVLKTIETCGVRDAWASGTGILLRLAGASDAVIAKIQEVSPLPVSICKVSISKDLASQMSFYLPSSDASERLFICGIEGNAESLAFGGALQSLYELIWPKSDEEDSRFVLPGKIDWMPVSDGVSATKTTLILSYPLYVLRDEVSNSVWDAIMDSKEKRVSEPNAPRTNISGLEAQKMCEKVGKSEGVQFRLPTTAEWQFMALGGRGSYFGDGFQRDGKIEAKKIAEIANVLGSSKGQLVGPEKVKGNELGLRNLLGNAEEFTLDGQQFRVLGGSMRDTPDSVALLKAKDVDGNFRDPLVGFRCVLSFDFRNDAKILELVRQRWSF